ncbi:efflux RND transporter periplasmic adaptor subunit [Microvirga thermotolerans]|uniref:Efflux RND transporter periplasmic adaptor subunit n=1 Tax=Microvirga thermotolerans TaxID=2651334 RepID=A0A5P9JWB3_9HYPH|nr:efflux RND transporter periplasmic adaptor subunit [Microvirga thermotolerans]QFU16509.1 efflux RND transporter periplasmic adaptor subunit [Microvirga thermotolerans]
MAWLKRILLLAVVLAAAATALVWAFSPRPVGVEATPVTEGPFRSIVEGDGRTRIRERYVVSAPLTGRVLRLSVKAGDEVREGSPVATLLPTPPQFLDPRARREAEERVGAAEASLEEASARLERALAQAAQAEADYQRVRTLQEKGAASQQQREREELSLRLAQRDLDAARFRKHAAEHDLGQARALLRRYDDSEPGERWEVAAPVRGRVLRVLQESETIVPAGAPLVEIGDPSDLEVAVDILTTDAVAVQPGAKVEIDHWGGPVVLEGRVRLVEPSAFTKVSALGVEEQRVWVVIDIVSPHDLWNTLGDGYRVDVRIVTEEIPKATLAPSGALFRRGDGWAVFVLIDGTAHERPVTVQRRSGRIAAIAAGLQPGDVVIPYPPGALHDGARVRIR